jgi:AcrR family transcriptional regulator
MWFTVTTQAPRSHLRDWPGLSTAHERWDDVPPTQPAADPDGATADPAAPAADSPRERRRAQRLESRRQEILGVAAELFSTHGYDGTSLERIADGSGYSVGGIYNFFANKQAVYEAVMERHERSLVERVREDSAGLPTGMDTLLEMAAAAIRTLREFPNRTRITVLTMARAAERPAGRNSLRTLLETYATAIQQGQRDGTVRAGDPRQLAQYVGGLVLAHMQIDPDIAGRPGPVIPLEDFLTILQGALRPADARR